MSEYPRQSQPDDDSTIIGNPGIAGSGPVVGNGLRRRPLLFLAVVLSLPPLCLLVFWLAGQQPVLPPGNPHYEFFVFTPETDDEVDPIDSLVSQNVIGSARIQPIQPPDRGY